MNSIMVLWWLLGAFALSALVGFGVWALLRHIRRRWVRISLSVVSGMFIFISAGAAFVLLGFAPASDEFHSDDRTFTIYVTTPGSWESWRGSQRFDLASEDSGVRFTDGALVPGEKFFDNLSVQKWPGNTAGSVPIKAPNPDFASGIGQPAAGFFNFHRYRSFRRHLRGG